MKKKTLFFQRLMCFIVFAGLGVSSASVMAGEVRTQDKPKEDGGYYNGHYHLKSKKDNKPYVNRDQHMKNPFHGFTKKSGKPKKQGQMPTSK